MAQITIPMAVDQDINVYASVVLYTCIHVLTVNVATLRLDILLPKPKINPKKDKIKLLFVNTILNASFHVHLIYLGG